LRGGGVIKEFDLEKNTFGANKINIPTNLQFQQMNMMHTPTQNIGWALN